MAQTDKDRYATQVAGESTSGYAKIVAVDDDGKPRIEGMGEVQATPTANTLLRRLKDLLTGITLAANSGVDIGDVDVTSIVDTILTKTRHPFAKGALTADGVQYSTAVSGIDNDAYDAIETIIFEQPPGMTLEEIEFGLTGRLDVSGTPTDNALWKWQASDDGSSWEDLIAEQTLSTPAAATDVPCSGRFAPTGNFLGTGTSFQVRMVAKCSGATDTVTGETKGSSYITARYRRA